MEDFVEDCYVEIDEEYEFEACQFYDFTRPENDSEIEEVERWFEVSGDYPQSPFIVKLNLENILLPQAAPKSSAKDRKNTKSISTCSATDSRHGVSHSKKNAKEKGSTVFQNTAKAKTRSLTFMEPTLSHLAKQHSAHEKHSSQLCTRFQRTSAKLERKCSNIVGFNHLEVKRQKLETGYIKKASQLKHQFSLSHKSSKKVTAPRVPEETQLGAQRRSSKNSCASSESEKQKQKGCNFTAYPSNKKILQARSLPQPRKNKPQSAEFQEAHSRANHYSSAKENRLSASDKLPQIQLIRQFTELSLGLNLKTNSASQLKRHSSAKDLNKDGTELLQAGFWRGRSKPNQCGGHTRVLEANMTRSLDIR